MAYDWRDPIAAEPMSAEYFDEIDRRFFHASPFFEGARPFERLIPFEEIKGKDVLEIGCGLGSHSQLLAEAGARLVSIDLTERGVQTTRERLKVRGLQADVRQMDAENLEFAPGSFDLVWSWGVIHHSTAPERIAQQVHRVLRPGGRFLPMVYHSRSIAGAGYVAKGLVLGRWLRGMRPREMMSFYADGYAARFYRRKEFAQLLREAGFATVTTHVAGQTTELFPWPGNRVGWKLKAALARSTPPRVTKSILSRAGMLLCAVATKAP